MHVTEQEARQFLENNNEEYLEFKTALDILGDKWSTLIILCIFEHPQRFVDIQKFVAGISPRTLTQRLHMLENTGLISRKEYKEFPPRTEYAVTKKAHELKAALMELKKWAKKYCTVSSAGAPNTGKK